MQPSTFYTFQRQSTHTEFSTSEFTQDRGGPGRASHHAEQNINQERSQRFQTVITHIAVLQLPCSRSAPTVLFLRNISLFSSALRVPKEAQKSLFVCRQLRLLFPKNPAATRASVPRVTPSPEGLNGRLLKASVLQKQNSRVGGSDNSGSQGRPVAMATLSSAPGMLVYVA